MRIAGLALLSLVLASPAAARGKGGAAEGDEEEPGPPGAEGEGDEIEVPGAAVGGRASLLEENSYTFFDHHGLGDRRAAIPASYRAIWEERAKLAVAKLAARLTAATSEGSLGGLLLHAGATRPDDDYIEIAIYADAGLDTVDVDLVTQLRAPTTPEEQHRWELVKEICATRSVAVIE